MIVEVICLILAVRLCCWNEGCVTEDNSLVRLCDTVGGTGRVLAVAGGRGFYDFTIVIEFIFMLIKDVVEQYQWAL